MSERSRRGAVPFSGLTPLLDVLFILLFSLLALSDLRRTEEQEEELRIELPEVEPGGEQAAGERRTLTIAIERDATLRMPGVDEPIRTRDALDRALAAALGEDAAAELGIELRADREAPGGVVVELLQHLRLAGFARVHVVATGYGDEGGFLQGGAR